MELAGNPAIPLLGKYPELKAGPQTNTWTPVFIQHHSQYPKGGTTQVSINRWIKRLWYIHTMEYYSAIKRNEIESFVETWVDLETVTQSEVSQKGKKKYCVLMQDRKSTRLNSSH